MIALIVATLILSFALTGLQRSYALKRNLLDITNLRSSHTLPTPSGGGMAIVLSMFCGTGLLYVWTVIDA